MTANASAPGGCSIELRETGVSLLRLAPQGTQLVTLNEATMLSLRAALEEIGRNRPSALIFAPTTEDMFCAGADVKLIEKVTSVEEGARLAKLGQEIFTLIEKLPFPTVAAISGPCVGGGCELALACRFRVITESRGSAIGLPEIQLGILPGFGGTQRLPRLVGLPQALDVILSGKILKPRRAQKIGLVDDIVTYQNLLSRAEAIALGSIKVRRRKLPLADRFATNTTLGRRYAAKQARAKVLSQTKGFYPAPLKALECVVEGLSSPQGNYALEAQRLGELVVTSECKSLVRLFFLSESAKAIGKSLRKSADSLSATVVGAGVMGAGVAAVMARSGMSVVLKDTSDDAVARGLAHIRKGLERSSSLTPQEKSFIVNRVEGTSKDSPNTARSGVAIEAVFEDMKVKREIFSQLASVMPAEAILATNTSSLSVSEMARGLPAPERFVGMHFFNPVEKMPLVEIIRGERTSDRTIVLTAALASKLGKSPIVVKDVPGFLVNRILTPYLCETAYLVAEGGDVEAIDAAATSFGMPMGPVRLLDEIGLDVAMHVLEIMVKGYGSRMESPNLSAQLVALGRKGKKNGAGFYDHGADGTTRPFADLHSALKITSRRELSREEIQDRLLLRLVNEAVLCHDEGVAGFPGTEASNQIDLGSVMGFGFPPFRGGLLFWANTLGAKSIMSKLTDLEKKYGSRFMPCPGLLRRAEAGRSLLEAAPK